MVDPFFEQILKASPSVVGLLVAMYALWQSWQDKAEAVKSFTALNQERKELQEKATAAIERSAVAAAKLEGRADEIMKQLHRLESMIGKHKDPSGFGE